MSSSIDFFIYYHLSPMHSPHHHIGRRIFFWTLVVLYISLISIIIPYAFGYRFSTERGVFVYAGSITVKANPQNVTVTVDDRIDTNPNYINNTYHITGVAPGAHTVHITRDEFQPVTKHITVSSGISTELWNVFLPRITYDRTILASLTIPFFYRAPHDAHIAVPHILKNNTLAVTFIDATSTDTTQTTTQIPQTYTQISPDVTRNIEWSRNAKMLILPVYEQHIDTQRNDALIITLGNTSTISIRSLFPDATQIGIVRWDPDTNRSLYAQVDRTLIKIILPDTQNTNADIQTQLIANDVRTYTIADNALYYLTNRTGIIHRIMRDGRSKQITTTPTTLSDKEPVALTVYDDDRITLHGTESGTLEFFDITLLNNVTTIAHDIRGTHFSDDGKKLLYWNDYEIRVFFIRAWEVAPLRSAGETITLARFVTPVHNVQWAHDYAHVLYTTNTALKITGLDNRGGRTTHTITSLDQTSIVRADYDARRLYITDKTNDMYNLFFINFPEKEGLF